MNHYDKLMQIKHIVENASIEIFKKYNNELELKFDNCNLLEDPDNSIESSTAIGYLLESFLVSEFKKYKFSLSNMQITGTNGSTNTISYDCKCFYENILTLINIKANKLSAQNNAVAAINKLYKDFVETDRWQTKAYLVLKVYYSIGQAKPGEKRKIIIHNVSSYFLDEVDLFYEHMQDKRSWSENSNLTSGRLQISDDFFEKHKLSIGKVSYENTCDMLSAVKARASS